MRLCLNKINIISHWGGGIIYITNKYLKRYRHIYRLRLNDFLCDEPWR
jgi:hypothetical protein